MEKIFYSMVELLTVFYYYDTVCFEELSMICRVLRVFVLLPVAASLNLIYN